VQLVDLMLMLDAILQPKPDAVEATIWTDYLTHSLAILSSLA
jgi:hypothetical protein